MATPSIARRRGFTESGALYFTPQEISPDLNSIPQFVQPIANCQAMPCSIHRGTEKAAYEASVLGRMVNQASYAYVHISYAPWLQAGCSLFIAKTGEAYRILMVPSVRPRFQVTAHVKCVLELYRTPPAGMPQIFYEKTFAYGVGLSSSTDTYIPGH